MFIIFMGVFFFVRRRRFHFPELECPSSSSAASHLPRWSFTCELYETRAGRRHFNEHFVPPVVKFEMFDDERALTTSDFRLADELRDATSRQQDVTTRITAPRSATFRHHEANEKTPSARSSHARRRCTKTNCVTSRSVFAFRCWPGELREPVLGLRERAPDVTR